MGGLYYEYGHMIIGGLLLLQLFADGVHDDGAVEFQDKGSDEHDIMMLHTDVGLLVVSSALRASAIAPVAEVTWGGGGDPRPAPRPPGADNQET